MEKIFKVNKFSRIDLEIVLNNNVDEAIRVSFFFFMY